MKELLIKDTGFTISYNRRNDQVFVVAGTKMFFPMYKTDILVSPNSSIILVCGSMEVNIDKQDSFFELVRKKNPIAIHTSYPGNYTLALIENKSIFIYNSPESTLPVFYYEKENKITISTIHSELPIDLVQDMDRELLACMLYDIRCLPYKSVKIVSTSQWLDVKAGKIEHQAWGIERKYDIQFSSFEEQSEYFINLMLASLRSQLSYSKKVGIMLSGGIDSTVLAYCVRQIKQDAILYTWATPSLPSCDEWKYAHLVSEIVRYPHRRIVIDGSDFEYGLLSQKDYEVPLLHNYSKAWEIACQQMEVDGVDTIISGYGAASFGMKKYNLKVLLKDLPVKERMKECAHAATNPFFKFSDILVYKSMETGYRDDFLRHIDFLNERYVKKMQPSDLDQHIFKMQEYAQEINIFNKHGLRCYHPYNNSVIQDFAASLPNACKNRMYMGQNMNKLLLRYAMQGKLPNQIVNRTYSASMSALIQKYVGNYVQENDLINSLQILIDYGIIEKERLIGVAMSNKQLMMNAQCLHTCLLLCRWINEKLGG